MGGYFGAMVVPWLAGHLKAVTNSFYPALILCVALTKVDVVLGIMLKKQQKPATSRRDKFTKFI
jgi:cyanate permease